MIGLALLLGAIALVYFFVIKPHTYWSRKKVKTTKFMPILGDYYRILLGKETLGEMMIRTYQEVQNVRYFGSYQFQVPALILKSPELLKQVCVKYSDHFLNHRNVLVDGVDELWTNSLVNLKGDHWRNIRSLVSPSFTSRKIKAMLSQMNQNANLFTQHFMKMKGETVKVDFRDAFTRYITDVTTSTTFGIQVDSLNDRDNMFHVIGRECCVLSNPWGLLVLMMYQICPAIASFIRLRLFRKGIQSDFAELVKNTIKIREEHNMKRSDMLGLLMEAQKGGSTDEDRENNKINSTAVQQQSEIKIIKQEVTESDIVSQVFIFFLGGFETLSSSMCFLAYELAVNTDVQKKLIEEIDEKTKENDEISYETLVGMTYLDMVVSENLRKWPSNVITDRVVTKPFTIQPELPGEEPLTLEVNQLIIIPLLAFHHDPKYFENPDKFNPERFSPENRKNIDPYTYFPFGMGVRNCIGSRFAILQIKTVFFHLLSHFEIVPLPETNIPIKLGSISINFKSVNGFPLGLKRRNQYTRIDTK